MIRLIFIYLYILNDCFFVQPERMLIQEKTEGNPPKTGVKLYSEGTTVLLPFSGADPGFQVRGGGGALKKIAPSGGRRENFWGISCGKSRFYVKKSYFFQF